MTRTVETVQAELDALKGARGSGVLSSTVSGEEGSYSFTYASPEALDQAIARGEKELAQLSSPSSLPAARVTRAVYHR